MSAACRHGCKIDNKLQVRIGWKNLSLSFWTFCKWLKVLHCLVLEKSSGCKWSLCLVVWWADCAPGVSLEWDEVACVHEQYFMSKENCPSQAYQVCCFFGQPEVPLCLFKRVKFPQITGFLVLKVSCKVILWSFHWLRQQHVIFLFLLSLKTFIKWDLLPHEPVKMTAF